MFVNENVNIPAKKPSQTTQRSFSPPKKKNDPRGRFSQAVIFLSSYPYFPEIFRLNRLKYIILVCNIIDIPLDSKLSSNLYKLFFCSR